MILDTALVQALLSTDNLSMALQVLSGPNYADVDACEDVMLEGNTIILVYTDGLVYLVTCPVNVYCASRSFF